MRGSSPPPGPHPWPDRRPGRASLREKLREQSLPPALDPAGRSLSLGHGEPLFRPAHRCGHPSIWSRSGYGDGVTACLPPTMMARMIREAPPCSRLLGVLYQPSLARPESDLAIASLQVCLDPRRHRQPPNWALPTTRSWKWAVR